MKLKIAGIIAATLLITGLLTPPVLAAPIGGCLQEQSCVETGKDSPEDDFSHNGLRRYDIFFDRLVAEGAISAELEAAIKSAIETAAKDARQQGSRSIDMSAILQTLVSEGKMTPEQKTAVEAAMRAERFGYILRRFQSAVNRLVRDGTVTEAEAQKLLTAAADASNSGIDPNMRALLDSLAKSGAINAVQRAAVEKALIPPLHGKAPQLRKVNVKDRSTA